MIYSYTIESQTHGPYSVLSIVPPEEGTKEGLPGEAIIGALPPNVTSVNPIDFRPNPVFIDFMHTVISRYAPLSKDLQNAAKHQAEGWIYIIDCRVPDPQGAVGGEDVIGAFKVESGAIVPDSYQRNDHHLLVSKRGPFCLDDWLSSKLLEETQSLLYRR